MTKYPIDKVRQLQRKLYRSAKLSKTRKFHALYERIYDWNILKESWKRIRQNQGAAGMDGQTLEAIEFEGVEVFLRGIQTYLQEGRYHPMPVKRVFIPKPDGTKRPLGIPTIRDRVVQMATKIVLEPVFEADFKDSSFGYRPKRSSLQAMEKIRVMANQGYNWVLDADIQNYFGSIDHSKLMEALRLRISDQRMLKLIQKWLKAGIMDESEAQESLVGTPQGGVISPLLSNIYLHRLDEVMDKNLNQQAVLVRYCDDFVVLTKTLAQAHESKRRIEKLLSELKLKLHPVKTKLVNLAFGKESFVFLGWFVRKCPSVRFPKRWYLNRWPSSQSMKKLYAKIRAMVHRRASSKQARDFVTKLNPILRGWANYFRTGNSFRKYTQVDKYLWQRLMLFENKRRRHTKPYWNPGRFNHAWFKSLGFFDLTQKGLIQYPGAAYAQAL